MRTAQMLLDAAQALLDATPIGDSFALQLAVISRDAMRLLVERETQEAN